MEQEKETPKVSEETKVKMPAANPYQKNRENQVLNNLCHLNLKKN
jgi:hypothetical protein